MADVKTSAFMLSSATVMIGKAFVDDVFALTPALHSVGMASEVSIGVDSSANDLLNGVSQSTVASKRTGVQTNISGNVFEMTAQNFMRSQAMSGQAGPVRRGILTANANAGALSLTLVSDPIPAEGTTALTSVNDIPAGSTILLQRRDGETDYVFPTKTSGPATLSSGTFTVPIAAPYGIPTGMSFAAGARVWVVTPVPVGNMDADDLFCVKVTGILSAYDRPVTYVAPKVRMIQGFQISYNETQYSSMPWQMRALLLSRGEVNSMPRLVEIGTRQAGLVYVGAGGITSTTPTPPDPEPGNSIFAAGVWNDNGIWNDNDLWKDAA